MTLDNQRTAHFFCPHGNAVDHAYRLKKRQYLEDNLADASSDASQDPDMRFHYGHLKVFPELPGWLCRLYDGILDANTSHDSLFNKEVMM